MQLGNQVLDQHQQGIGQFVLFFCCETGRHIIYLRVMSPRFYTGYLRYFFHRWAYRSVH